MIHYRDRDRETNRTKCPEAPNIIKENILEMNPAAPAASADGQPAGEKERGPQ